MQIMRQSQRGPVETSLVAAVNDAIDMHTARITGLFDKLPPLVMGVLVLIAAASLALAGFHAGISGQMSHWRMTILALACILFVIMDFDRPNDGLIRISQDSLFSAIANMEANLAR